MDDNLLENLENYKAQLSQVEAALLIDSSDEDLLRLQKDLEEVIALTNDLIQINEAEGIPEKEATSKAIWKVGDRVQVYRKIDGMLHTATIDMISEDGVSCTVKFDNSGLVDLVKVSLLSRIEKEDKKITIGTKPVNKLTREELEKRKEIKKKKLMKKKQRMKDFEEARETGKQKWQTFFKKGNLKGKNKVRGLNKKSIFASAVDGKGKIGIGTCGTSGKGMTSFTPASQYMYKK